MTIDKRFLPENFESLKKAKKETRLRIKALYRRSSSASHRLASLLEECLEDEVRCHSAACSICSRDRRSWLIPAVIRLTEEHSDTEWVVVTLIFYSDAMPNKKVSKFEVLKLKGRLIKQFKRLGIEGPVIGGFEMDHHSDIKKWLPHFHLLMPKQDKALDKLKAYMKQKRNMATRLGVKSRPVFVQKLKDPTNQISYLFKSYWARIESYRRPDNGKRETKKRRLKDKELALSLRTMSRFGFSGLLFIYGARLSGQQVIVSGN